jgi:dATP pyrophosphohydrolase
MPNETSLIERLTHPQGNGVYLLPRDQTEALSRALKDKGKPAPLFFCALGDDVQADALLRKLGLAMGFPPSYGQNLDALHDCLTDLSWQTSPGAFVFLTDCRPLQQTSPTFFDTLLAVFRAATTFWQAADISFSVFLDTPAESVSPLSLIDPSKSAASGREQNCFKQPRSVLVLIHTANHDVLILERTAHPGYWQSVTGSREANESPVETAIREVFEETGLSIAESELHVWPITNHFEIYPQWRGRYAPGVTRNAEQVFSLCVPEQPAVRLAPEEHRACCWLPWRAAADQVFSWTNRDAILQLGLGRNAG